MPPQTTHDAHLADTMSGADEPAPVAQGSDGPACGRRASGGQVVSSVCRNADDTRLSVQREVRAARPAAAAPAAP